MTDKNFTEKRRKLLLSIAAGSSAVVTGKSLPDVWVRPVVDSVMLPAHAQTSGVAPVECIGESLTIDQSNAGVAVLFDGVVPASLTTVVNWSDQNPDYFVAIDLDPNDDADIVVGRGDNWSPAFAIIEENMPDGTYTRSSTRMVQGQPTGNTYEVTFCITTTGTGSAKTLTVVLVSMVQI